MELDGKRVLIWGLGRHGGGLAAARHCAARGARVGVLDREPLAELGAAGAEVRRRGWSFVRGGPERPELRESDLVICSPAIRPALLPSDIPPERCVGPAALFFAEHRGPRIAITGTKGKSTTVHLLAHLLDRPAAGNSNRPLLDLLATAGPETPVVCELSSFQLWYLRHRRPRFAIACLTSLAVDHLDWHPDVEHYRRSKLDLLDWADSLCLPDGLAADLGRTGLPLVDLVDGDFVAPGHGVVASREDLSLLGDHNAQNARLAITCALAAGAPPAAIRPRLAACEALPHRLREVHRRGDLRFVDDSIATTPEAAAAACRAVDGPAAVILGGSDKGADFAPLARLLAEAGRPAPVLLGATAPRLDRALRAYGIRAPIANELAGAVGLAVAAIGGRGTVLLSPACASFDRFTGFEQRGDAFAACARAIAPETDVT